MSSDTVTNKVIAAEPRSQHILEVLDMCGRNIEESMDRGDRNIDVWKISGSQLSVYLNRHEDEILGYKRLTSNEAVTIFTRYSCGYKESPLGNWTELQKGDHFPVYRKDA